MKKDKLPSLISILIMTLITSVFWVSLTTYRAFTVKPAENVPEDISNPINLNLNQSAIKTVESRIFLDSSQIPDQVSTNLSSPAPIQLKMPLPTPASLASPTSSPSSSPVVP